MTPREGRRETIIDEASRLFAERGFHGVQMDEIARLSGVAKGTLYNHFGSKDQLYAAVLRSRLSGLVDQLERAYELRNEPWRDLHSFVVHWQGFMVRNPYFFRLWRLEGGNARDEEFVQLKNRVDEILCRVIEHGQQEGCFRPCAPDEVADMILGMLDYRVCSLIAAEEDGRDAAAVMELLRHGLEKEITV